MHSPKHSPPPLPAPPHTRAPPCRTGTTAGLHPYLTLTSSSSSAATYSGTTLPHRRSVSKSSKMLLPLLVTSTRYMDCGALREAPGLGQQQYSNGVQPAIICSIFVGHQRQAHGLRGKACASASLLVSSMITACKWFSSGGSCWSPLPRCRQLRATAAVWGTVHPGAATPKAGATSGHIRGGRCAAGACKPGQAWQAEAAAPTDLDGLVEIARGKGRSRSSRSRSSSSSLLPTRNPEPLTSMGWYR